MRGLALSCALVAACSSGTPAPAAAPRPTPRTATTPDAGVAAVPVPLPVVDAAPADPVEVPLPAVACLPAAWSDVVALDDGRARLCWSRTPGVERVDTCLWIGRDGAA